MRSLRLMFWIGILLVILPFLGIPRSYKQPVYIVAGASIVLINIYIRSRYVTDLVE